MDFAEVVGFHGHICPGLAMGYMAAEFAVQELGFERDRDEELVAVVENNSCAVDAIQMVTGCTFGKGNFIFKDYGKQVYTFMKRSGGEALRLAVKWEPPAEDPVTADYWKKYMAGDRSPEVTRAVADRKRKKADDILSANPQDLFSCTYEAEKLPTPGQIHPTVICQTCGDRVMKPKAKEENGLFYCIPCMEK